MIKRSPLRPVETLSPKQEDVASVIVAGPRGTLRLPFRLLLHSPQLAATLSPVGEYLRYGSDLPPVIREIAILVTAHEYGCRYEWDSHAHIAREAGLSAKIIDEIRGDTALVADGSPERLALEFCRELHRRRSVPAGLQQSITGHFGVEGLTDLVGLCGYYGVLAMMLNLTNSEI